MAITARGRSCLPPAPERAVAPGRRLRNARYLHSSIWERHLRGGHFGWFLEPNQDVARLR
jgi:hypothetical protein